MDSSRRSWLNLAASGALFEMGGGGGGGGGGAGSGSGGIGGASGGGLGGGHGAMTGTVGPASGSGAAIQSTMGAHPWSYGVGHSHRSGDYPRLVGGVGYWPQWLWWYRRKKKHRKA